MQIQIECITCFVHQAQNIIKKNIADKKKQNIWMRKVLRQFPPIQKEMLPIDLSPYVYHYLSKKLKIKDLFYEEKTKTNQIALSLVPFLKQMLKKSSTPLADAIKLSIIGNIIDYGIQNIQNIDLEEFIQKKIQEKLFYDERMLFEKQLSNAKTLLYLTDNSGEIIFDKILLETIQEYYPHLHIVIGAKEKPILNDVTKEDLKDLGFETIGKIVSTGSDLPGNKESILLKNKKIKDIYKNADICIAKGQGNFEGLWEAKKKIFFALMIKCPVLANYLGVPLNSMIFKTNRE